MAGIEGVEPLQPTWVEFTDGGDPLKATDLANAPIQEWDNIIAQKGPPANPEEFAANLRNMIGPSLEAIQTNGHNSVFNVTKEVARGLHGLAPNDASGGNSVVEALQTGATQAFVGEYGENFKNMSPQDQQATIAQFGGQVAAAYENKIDEIVNDALNPATPEVAPVVPEADGVTPVKNDFGVTSA